VDDLAQNNPSLQHRRSRCSRLLKWARLYTRIRRAEQQRGARRRSCGDRAAGVFLGEKGDNGPREELLAPLASKPRQRPGRARADAARPLAITDPRLPIRCLGTPPAPAALVTRRRPPRTPGARRRRAVPVSLPGAGCP